MRARFNSSSLSLSRPISLILISVRAFGCNLYERMELIWNGVELRCNRIEWLLLKCKIVIQSVLLYYYSFLFLCFYVWDSELICLLLLPPPSSSITNQNYGEMITNTLANNSKNTNNNKIITTTNLYRIIIMDLYFAWCASDHFSTSAFHTILLLLHMYIRTFILFCLPQFLQILSLLMLCHFFMS